MLSFINLLCRSAAASCPSPRCTPTTPNVPISLPSRLLDESGSDVRPFIENNAFRPHASPLETRSPTTTLLGNVDAELHAAKARRISDSLPSSPAPTAGVPGGKDGLRRSKDVGFSLLDAVYLLLSTGPLANYFDWATISGPSLLTGDARAGQHRLPSSSGDDRPEEPVVVCSTSGAAGGAGIAAAAASEHIEKSDVTVAIAGVGGNKMRGGSGGGENMLSLAEVSAVRELLEEVCAAAERWKLGRIEKERLKSWLGAVNALEGQRALTPGVEVLCPA